MPESAPPDNVFLYSGTRQPVAFRAPAPLTNGGRLNEYLMPSQFQPHPRSAAVKVFNSWESALATDK